MNRFTFLVAFAFFISISTLVLAEPGKPQNTQIVADEKAGIVRIFIDGKEILAVDANGLRVNGNLDYRGTIADIGPESKNVP